jgi:hypothetical protein
MKIDGEYEFVLDPADPADWSEQWTRHRKATIRMLAERHGWQEQKEVVSPPVLVFLKRHPQMGRMQVNVYWTRGTVQTTLKHPKDGRNQGNRKNVGLVDLEKIFENPRVHGMWLYNTTEERKALEIGDRKTFQKLRRERRHQRK